MNGQNLLPQCRREHWRVRRCVNTWAMSLFTLSLLVAGLIVGAVVTQPRAATMPVGLTDKMELDRSELALANEQIRRLKLTKTAEERAQAVPQWAGLLAVLARDAGAQTQLRAIRVEPGTDPESSWVVSIVGVAAARQTPATLAENLEATGLFVRVRHGLGPTTAGREDFDFYLDCIIAPGASE